MDGAGFPNDTSGVPVARWLSAEQRSSNTTYSTMIEEQTSQRSTTNTLVWKVLAILLLVKELHEGIRSRSSLVLCEDTLVKEQQSASSSSSNNHNNILIPHSAWCPQTTCGGGGGGGTNATTTTQNDDDDDMSSSSCNLCHHRFLILLALGRTASTTLTWTLDAGLPGLRMAGENNGVINQLYDVFTHSIAYPNYVKGTAKPNTPWGHGPLRNNDTCLLYTSPSPRDS